MEIYLWIAQSVLAIIFLGSGLAKTTMSNEKMAATGQTGVANSPITGAKSHLGEYFNTDSVWLCCIRQMVLTKGPERVSHEGQSI